MLVSLTKVLFNTASEKPFWVLPCKNLSVRSQKHFFRISFISVKARIDEQSPKGPLADPKLSIISVKNWKAFSQETLTT